MKQTKTIPFDWEEYNNNRDKYKVITRGNDEVTQLTNFSAIGLCPLYGVLNGNLKAWYLGGKFQEHDELSHNYDLQLQYEEEVKESWVALFRAEDGSIFCGLEQPTKEEATPKSSNNLFIKVINLNELV